MTNKQKTALITGGAKRIGAGVAKILAENGFNLAIHYNSSKKQANELCSELNTKRKIAFPVKGDLQSEKDIEKIFSEAKEKLGNIFCLVNNASTFEYDNLNSFNNHFWEKHLLVNLKAPVLLSKLFKKNLPSKCNGKIVNIIDQRVFNLTPHFLSYTLSKSGLWTLTKTLALDLAPNITVNAIGPGPALRSKFQTKKQFEDQCRNMPLRVGTTTQEIGKTVLFFIKSSSITGQMLALDGGQHLGWGQVKNKNVDKE